MWRYLAGRLLSSVVVLLLVVTITFTLIQIAPGGLSILMDPNMPAEEIARLERNFGLDRPAHVQYLSWLGSLMRGDLGVSMTYGHRPVTEMVTARLPATLLLGIAAALVTIVLGIPLGIYAARRQNQAADHLVGVLSSIGLAAPNFWLGILLIVLFSVQLSWLPSSGTHTIGEPFSVMDRLRHLLLPTVVLATSSLAELVRYTRSSWLEVLRLDYIRTARGKGLGEQRINYRHVMKNALIPILTVFGVSLPRMVGGSAVVETLFGWPGLGQLAVDAALRRDAALILGITIVVSLAVIVSNLVIDMIYPVLDPRIRYT